MTSADIINGTPQKTVIPRDPRKRLTTEEIAALFVAANIPKFRALGHRLIVRVTSPPEKTAGGLFLPMHGAGGSQLYDDRLGTKVFIVGEVLSAGPRAHERAKSPTPFEPGDRVFFSRMNFGWISRVEGDRPDRGDYIGFIDPEHCEARVDFEE